MTRWLRDAPLGRKVAVLMVGGGLWVTALATAALVAWETRAAREQAAAAVEGVAAVVAYHVAPALAFDDRAVARQGLDALRAVPDVTGAVLWNARGEVFAAWGPGLPAEPPEPGLGWEGEGFSLTRPVRLEGEVVGALWVRSGLATLHQRLGRYGAVAAAALLVAAAAAVGAAWLLRVVVADRIRRLAAVAERAAREGDYAVRAKDDGRDEVGVLARGLNHLLEAVEIREAELRRHRDHLEDRVRERTRELREAKEAAEKASRAKSRFLALVSHELRTPLTTILGEADLALRGEGGDPRPRLERIRDAGRALRALVEDLLDVGRIEAGDVRLEARPFSPAGVVREVAEAFRARAEAKGLLLRVEAGAGPEVLGDPIRVRQILWNLLDNAIKFTERGWVAVRSGAGPEGGVRFEVEDTGPGIPAADRERVFRAFEQGEALDRRHHPGAGLGLPICRSLAGLMGGTVAVADGAEGGARFRVDLPLPPAEAGPPADLRGLRVLVAEDNPLNRSLARAFLETLGCRVEEAADGEAALAAWSRGRPDAVLLDCQMPGVDGFEVARRIREAEGGTGRRTWIVACTAYGSEEDRERCRAAGMDRVVLKPFGAEDLARSLRPAAGGAEEVDRAVVDRILALERAGRAGLAARVVAAYREEAARLAGELQEALGRADPEAVHRAAHALKSVSLNAGAAGLARRCARVSEAARRGDLEGARREAEAIVTEWPAAARALEEAFGGTA